MNIGFMTNIRALLAYNIKNGRKTLGISQEELAEKASTSSHYISQIEQQNKFPSPEMLERIAAALEIDSPALFSMTSFSDEALKRFHSDVLSDLVSAVNQTLDARIPELKNMK